MLTVIDKEGDGAMKNSDPPHFFVGSLPFIDPGQAMDFVSKYSRHLPFLPQLPGANPQEDMIGQVLRGYEIGRWDNLASSCFELFLHRYSSAKKAKFQIAGPFTSSKAMSMAPADGQVLWSSLVIKLLKQWEDAGFTGELWLQIDEPFWSIENPLFPGYEALLTALKKFGKDRLQLGIHSCALPRPSISSSLFDLVDFWSFDYTVIAMSAEERILWTQAIDDFGKNLVAGVFRKVGAPTSDHVIPIPAKRNRLWFSAACGLYDWNMEEISASFGKV